MNMSYCRFENTLGDLTDCLNAIEELEAWLERRSAIERGEETGDDGAMSAPPIESREEMRKAIRLIRLCEHIAERFGEESDTPEESDVLTYLRDTAGEERE